MRRWANLVAAAVVVGACGINSAHADSPPVVPAPPSIPTDVKGKDGVKAYLLAVMQSCVKAAADLKASSDAYSQLAAAHGGDPVAAAKAEPQKIADLIRKLRDAYQRLDSFGYEYIEGIVAGVPSLQKYDVELDSGVPKSMASGAGDNVANVVIKAGDLTLDHEGSINNFLIEPTVYGSNAKFIVGKAALPGFDQPVGLPRPQLVKALAEYAVQAYGRLMKDSQAWTPTDLDCCQAIHNMTPTLADYFEEWKESKVYGGAAGGRFVAVSRVSDMRGIMSSVRLTWQGLEPQVKAKDPALAKSVSDGYAQIMTFIDTTDARDKAQPLNAETIDALGSQAKERADKLTVQTAQAASLLGVEVTGK